MLECGNLSLNSMSRADMEERLARLTPAQLDALELVALRRTSKEIARELGISPVTVDQRIKRAQLILGASNRNEAARFLISARQAYGKTIYGSSGLSMPAAAGKLEGSFGEWNPADDNDAQTMMQSQAAYFASPIEGTKERQLLSVLEEIRRPENLTPTAKTIIIIAIMIGTIFTIAMLVSLVEGISRLI